MDIQNLTHQEQEAYFAEYILAYLQKHDGKAKRNDIKKCVIAEREDVARFSKVIRYSKTTGKPWCRFEYKIGHGFSALKYMGYINNLGRSEWGLTSKGASVELDNFDAMKEVIKPWINKGKQ